MDSWNDVVLDTDNCKAHIYDVICCEHTAPIWYSVSTMEALSEVNVAVQSIVRCHGMVSDRAPPASQSTFNASLALRHGRHNHRLDGSGHQELAKVCSLLVG
jgi:hypothetical protein